jgi:predicted negative regulator of RcsB-dependent stress response
MISMRRFIGLVALAALIGVVASQALFAQDRVERRDKKTGSVTVTGKITEENAGGVRVKGQGGFGKDETIPSSEIVRIRYADLPAKASLELEKLSSAELGRDYPTLLKGYEGVQSLPELKNAPLPIRRYIDFRIASLRAATAEGDEQVKAAIKGLGDYIAANPDSWEYPHVARQLGRLQADTGDYNGATKTFESLEKAANVPAEFKTEATAALIDTAFQSENYDAGKKRVDAVAKNPSAPPALKARVDMYQLALEGAKGDLMATVKKIEEAIGKATDPSLKALGYNVLGDVYLAKDKSREAMWSYLWVDVVYNQDRGEHLKAMTRLMKIFEKANETDKVQLYKEKLARSR